VPLEVTRLLPCAQSKQFGKSWIGAPQALMFGSMPVRAAHWVWGVQRHGKELGPDTGSVASADAHSPKKVFSNSRRDE